MISMEVSTTHLIVEEIELMFRKLNDSTPKPVIPPSSQQSGLNVHPTSHRDIIYLCRTMLTQATTSKQRANEPITGLDKTPVRIAAHHKE
jgi:hypothetical protein